MSNASDWYTVGATLYHALTGRLPFDGPVRELIERKMTRGSAVRVRARAGYASTTSAMSAWSMLDRHPAARMSGREALDRLSLAEMRSRRSAVGESSEAVFVGRKRLWMCSSAAFANVQARRSVSVFIHGPSGIGKSALVQHFIDRRLRGQSVLVLRSRCHEHESIPYKALDGVDRQHDPAPERAATDGAGAGDAARRARAGQAVPGHAHRDRRARTRHRHRHRSASSLRRQAFAAFRDLLGLLATRQPLVIDIDDFHWADADSIRWLTELLRPPSPPSLLTLVSFRSEELDAKPFLRSLIERIDIGERLSLSLAPMSNDEVTRAG